MSGPAPTGHHGERPMLTAKQHELLHFIQQRLDASGISPSFEEMKEALGLKSKSGIHRLISALEERGFLRRRSEEHTSELQSLMRISYAAFCLNKKIQHHYIPASKSSQVRH